MLPWSFWALLLFCTTAAFLGWLGLAASPEKVGTPPPELEFPPHIPLKTTTGDNRFQDEATSREMSHLHFCHDLEELSETWKRMRSALDEIPMVQLMEDIAHWIGNVSSCGATELQEGHQIVPSNLHQGQERIQDTCPQPESNLVLQEVMEKLQRVNQSLELMLAALEDARSQLEKHMEHLNSIPDPNGQNQSATSSCIPYGSYFVLLVLQLVPTPFRAILFLLFLASSALGIPALSTLLVLVVAGQWLVASTCRGSRGIRPVAPREGRHFRLTSTPERWPILRASSWMFHSGAIWQRFPGRECDMELLQEELNRIDMSSLREPSYLEQPQEVAKDIPTFTGRVSPVPGGWRTMPSSCGVMPEPVMDSGKRWEPKPCSPRAKMSPCQGLTRAGQRCRKKTIPGQEFCHIHTPTDSSPHF